MLAESDKLNAEDKLDSAFHRALVEVFWKRNKDSSDGGAVGDAVDRCLRSGDDEDEDEDEACGIVEMLAGTIMEIGYNQALGRVIEYVSETLEQSLPISLESISTYLVSPGEDANVSLNPEDDSKLKSELVYYLFYSVDGRMLGSNRRLHQDLSKMSRSELDLLQVGRSSGGHGMRDLLVEVSLEWLASKLGVSVQEIGEIEPFTSYGDDVDFLTDILGGSNSSHKLSNCKSFVSQLDTNNKGVVCQGNSVPECRDYCDIVRKYRARQDAIAEFLTQVTRQYGTRDWPACHYGTDMRTDCMKLMPTEFGLCFATYYG